jgi:hypothetical protein
LVVDLVMGWRMASSKVDTGAESAGLEDEDMVVGLRGLLVFMPGDAAWLSVIDALSW